MNYKSKLPFLLLLLSFPFIISGMEKLVIKPLLTSNFTLPETSVFLFIIMTSSLLMFSFAALRKNSYGLEFNTKYNKTIAALFILLIIASYLFLFALKTKCFFDDLAVIHLANWIICVFREEFLLRGIIQTEASDRFKGEFLKVSNAIWISTIAFSLWHLVNLAYWPWQVVLIQVIGLIPVGIVLGKIREKTNSTLLTYLIHISGDLLFTFFYVLITGQLFHPLY